MSQYTKNPDVIATLSPEEFYVTQESGTERPFQNEYDHEFRDGIYLDIVSKEVLDNKITTVEEIERMYSIGRLTPQQWMLEAVGEKISNEPILNLTEKAVNQLN